MALLIIAGLFHFTGTRKFLSILVITFVSKQEPAKRFRYIMETITRGQALTEALNLLNGFDSPQLFRDYAIEQIDVGDKVHIQFGMLTDKIPALVKAVHLYSNKQKYDLEIHIPDYSEKGVTWKGTRIYNVDPEYVSKIKSELPEQVNLISNMFSHFK